MRSNSLHVILPELYYYRICNNISNTTGATCGAGSAYPSGEPEINPSFWWGSCCLVFSFLCCVICTIICLFVFLFLAMALSLYFQSMSLTVPLVSFVPYTMVIYSIIYRSFWYCHSPGMVPQLIDC